MWKFHDFSITQILHEINFRDFQSAKSAILTQLEALNSYFHEFLHLLKAENTKLTRLKAPKMAKTADFALLESPTLISRKM